MARCAARCASSALAGLVALSLALSPPIRAADPVTPEGLVCMSDQQLRTYLTYTTLVVIHEYLDFCLGKARDRKVDVEAALLKYGTAAYPLIERLRDEVTEIYRPTYGDKAQEITVAVRKIEQDRASSLANRSWGVSDCLNLIKSARTLAAEMTPDEHGPSVRTWVEKLIPIRRAYVAPCPG